MALTARKLIRWMEISGGRVHTSVESGFCSPALKSRVDSVTESFTDMTTAGMPGQSQNQRHQSFACQLQLASKQHFGIASGNRNHGL